MKRKTVKEKVSFEGKGIHTGEKTKVEIYPSEGEGIVFIKDSVEIKLSPEAVVNTSFSTDIGKEGVVIKTVEHLLAVFHLLGITDAIVEVKGSEIPIMDGSGYIFYKVLKDKIRVLEKSIEPLKIRKRIVIRKNDAILIAEPHEKLNITYEGDFNGYLGRQKFTFKGNAKDIILARTFCFEEDIPLIKKLGLGRGGSLENTLVIGHSKILNKGGMRYKEEPVRHKILDLVGDLYLLGRPVKGRFYSFKGGHTLNYLLVKEIFSEISETSLLKASPLSI